MKRDELISVVEAAVLAPSVHNTQPWRFAVHAGPASTGSIDLYADRSRLLAVADPNGRELYISCGAAIEFARVAARSLALECRVQLLPETSDEDHLARLAFEGEELPTATDLALAQAIPKRYTERGRFEDRPIPDALVERLRECVVPYDAFFKVLGPGGEETAAAVLLAMADEIETSSADYEAEAAGWTREEPGRPDGVPAYLERQKMSGRASSFKLRGFGAETGRAVPPAEEAPPPPEHPLVALLGTPGDDYYYWLQAGRALGRLLLTAAAEGVAASPMTQVLEVEATRELLSHELDLVGHPQVLLRLGYASGRPSTPRRPLEEVLVDSSPGEQAG